MSIVPRAPQPAQADGRPPSAVDLFLAGLPDRHGRVVTASAQIDSWKRKHPTIAQRLQREHLERTWRTARFGRAAR